MGFEAFVDVNADYFLGLHCFFHRYVNNRTIVVIVVENYGQITLELFDEKKPKTVANFLAYVKENFYSQTLFHRVIKDFMIQGGGYVVGHGWKRATHSELMPENENFIPNSKYTVAMARSGERANNQFFINTVHNKHLDDVNPPFVVFGFVVEGQSVVDAIEQTSVDPEESELCGRLCAPLKPILISKIEIVS